MIWKNFWAEVEGSSGLIPLEEIPKIPRDPSELSKLCGSEPSNDHLMQAYYNLFVGPYAERCLAVPDSELFPGLRIFFDQLFDAASHSPEAMKVLNDLSHLPRELSDVFLSNYLMFMAGVVYAEHIIFNQKKYDMNDLADTPQISPNRLITSGEYAVVCVSGCGVKGFKTYDEYVREELAQISLLPITSADFGVLERVGQAFVKYNVENGMLRGDGTFRVLYTDALWRSMRLAHADLGAEWVDLALPFERGDFLCHRFSKGGTSPVVLHDLAVSCHNFDMLGMLKVLGYKSELDPFTVMLFPEVLEKVGENSEMINQYILGIVRKFKEGKASYVELERKITELYDSLRRERPWDNLGGFLSCKSVELPDYKINRKIGPGGAHKKVFEATHIPTGETRIVKLLSPTKIGADSLKDRGISLDRLAQREYMLASGKKFYDDHLSKIRDIIVSDGNIYLIEEPFDETLADVLSRETRLEKGRTLRYICELTSVLAGCHNMMDMAHGDLKPENIGLKNGKIKLSDFGIAATIGTEDEHFAIGSTRMKAPEFLGTNFQPTEQSDIWAIGVLMYRMLSGEFPFLYKQLSTWEERIPHEREIKADILDKITDAKKKRDFFSRCQITQDDPLLEILDHCLTIDRQARYVNCLPLLQDLQVEVDQMRKSAHADEYAVFEETFQKETGYPANVFLNMLCDGGLPERQPEHFAQVKRFVYATLKNTEDARTKETCYGILMSISRFRLRTSQ